MGKVLGSRLWILGLMAILCPFLLYALPPTRWICQRLLSAVSRNLEGNYSLCGFPEFWDVYPTIPEIQSSHEELVHPDAIALLRVLSERSRYKAKIADVLRTLREISPSSPLAKVALYLRQHFLLQSICQKAPQHDGEPATASNHDVTEFAKELLEISLPSAKKPDATAENLVMVAIANHYLGNRKLRDDWLIKSMVADSNPKEMIAAKQMVEDNMSKCFPHASFDERWCWLDMLPFNSIHNSVSKIATERSLGKYFDPQFANLALAYLISHPVQRTHFDPVWVTAVYSFNKLSGLNDAQANDDLQLLTSHVSAKMGERFGPEAGAAAAKLIPRIKVESKDPKRTELPIPYQFEWLAVELFIWNIATVFTFVLAIWGIVHRIAVPIKLTRIANAIWQTAALSWVVFVGNAVYPRGSPNMDIILNTALAACLLLTAWGFCANWKFAKLVFPPLVIVTLLFSLGLDQTGDSLPIPLTMIGYLGILLIRIKRVPNPKLPRFGWTALIVVAFVTFLISPTVFAIYDKQRIVFNLALVAALGLAGMCFCTVWYDRTMREVFPLLFRSSEIFGSLLALGMVVTTIGALTAHARYGREMSNFQLHSEAVANRLDQASKEFRFAIGRSLKSPK